MNEKKLRKFKLIDREGYINAHPNNKKALKGYFIDDIVEGRISNAGNLLVGRSWAVITASEFKFFEEVHEEIKEDNNMKVRAPVTKRVRKPATRRVTAPHKAPFTTTEQTTKQLTEQTTKPAMTAGTRKSLEELLERAIAYQTELFVAFKQSDLPLEHAHSLLDTLNNNRKTIEHFHNALKEGKED